MLRSEIFHSKFTVLGSWFESPETVDLLATVAEGALVVNGVLSLVLLDYSALWFRWTEGSFKGELSDFILSCAFD